MFSSNRSRTNCTWNELDVWKGPSSISKGIHLSETKENILLPEVYCMESFQQHPEGHQKLHTNS